jgi:hypothetical protein
MITVIWDVLMLVVAFVGLALGGWIVDRFV